MSWTDELARSVREVLQLGSEARVAVHSEAQAELGRRAAERLAKQVGGNPHDLTFEVIPEDHQGQYPIGVVLVS